jgi:hypothetical protein
MRDWFWPLAPVVVVVYFLAFPSHLSVIPLAFAWMSRMARTVM